MTAAMRLVEHLRTGGQLTEAGCDAASTTWRAQALMDAIRCRGYRQ
jgi:hypothetical protein